VANLNELLVLGLFYFGYGSARVFSLLLPPNRLNNVE